MAADMAVEGMAAATVAEGMEEAAMSEGAMAGVRMGEALNSEGPTAAAAWRLAAVAWLAPCRRIEA